MGDKSPKSKQKDKSQKSTAKAQAKAGVTQRQSNFAAQAGKDSKKK